MNREDFLKGLGKRITDRRKELGLTQDELAKKVGYVSHSTITKVESGLIDLPQSKIAAIADALDCSPAYIMGISNTPEDTAHRKHVIEQEENKIFIPEKYKDVAVAFHGGGDNLTQEDIDDIVRFIEFIKNKKK